MSNNTIMASDPSQHASKHLTYDEIASIIQEHPGVHQALIYPSPTPDKKDALMAAVAFKTNYEFPRKPGRGWDNGVDRTPQDRDEFFVAVSWEQKEDVNALFDFFKDKLPEEYYPTFFRIIYARPTGGEGGEQRDITSDLNQLRDEGWDHDRIRSGKDWGRLFWRPNALGKRNDVIGFLNFWDVDRKSMI
jgi:hypothetical protein